jgi:FdhD protein
MTAGKDDSVPTGLYRVRVERRSRVEDDWVAVEEPLEIRVDGEPLVVTMRTPGHDRELAAGFLLTEGVVAGRGDLESIEPCRDPLAYDPDNLIQVRLTESARAAHARVKQARRDFTATAACGLCGKARIEDVFQRIPDLEPRPFPIDFLAGLPQRMRREQSLFDATGGLHAAAIFDLDGELLVLREDIGRHNAVDKVVGHALLAGEVPMSDRILVVSARAGFEIVQKAMMAAIPTLVAVGAASSLAVRTALEGGLALYSFVGEGRGNRHVGGATRCPAAANGGNAGPASKV